jgi:acyl phosphate:glycerol-3-phosphate acyltransferase
MSGFALIAATSYLLGSIPFGYLLVRIFRGEDVRRSGSGNIGATNVSRKSPLLGILTLVLDAAKGFVAVELAVAFSRLGPDDPRLFRLMAASALLAILGHMFPLWLGFRGGKGVATALGAFLRFSPLAVLCAVIIFLMVVAVSRRVSLGSIVTAALFPVVVWFLGSIRDGRVTALLSAVSALIIGRHHENIRRLLSGDEPRFSLGSK